MNKLCILLFIYFSLFWSIESEPNKLTVNTPRSIRMNQNFTVTWTYNLNATDKFDSFYMQKDKKTFFSVLGGNCKREPISKFNLFSFVIIS